MLSSETIERLYPRRYEKSMTREILALTMITQLVIIK